MAHEKTLLESLVNEACRANLKCLLKTIENKGTDGMPCYRNAGETP